jgi:hypothetical protein
MSLQPLQGPLHWLLVLLTPLTANYLYENKIVTELDQGYSLLRVFGFENDLMRWPNALDGLWDLLILCFSGGLASEDELSLYKDQSSNHINVQILCSVL